MRKLKVGDNVKVTLGKDKGREGKIEKVFYSQKTLIIPGINVYKKNVKAANVKEGQKGGIYELPRPLAFSKIALVCPKCKKTTRVGFNIVGTEKLRLCKKCGKEIDTK